MEQAEAIESVTLIFLIMAWILNDRLGGGNLHHFLILIRTITIIIHMVLLQVNTPAMMLTIFNIVRHICLFEINDIISKWSVYTAIAKWLGGVVNLELQRLYNLEWSMAVFIGYST